jgi:enoyl-CoA hydratase/carnithine racemase
MNFVRIGLNPGMAAEFWASRDNHVLLREMLLTGAIYSTSDSRMKQLFNLVASPEEIAAAVESAASAIAANSPQAIRISLALLRNPLLSREEVMQREAEGQGKCMSTGEIKESVAAQREGRVYRFQR